MWLEKVLASGAVRKSAENRVVSVAHQANVQSRFALPARPSVMQVDETQMKKWNMSSVDYPTPKEETHSPASFIFRSLEPLQSLFKFNGVPPSFLVFISFGKGRFGLMM